MCQDHTLLTTQQSLLSCYYVCDVMLFLFIFSIDRSYLDVASTFRPRFEQMSTSQTVAFFSVHSFSLSNVEWMHYSQRILFLVWERKIRNRIHSIRTRSLSSTARISSMLDARNARRLDRSIDSSQRFEGMWEKNPENLKKLLLLTSILSNIIVLSYQISYERYT